MRKVFLAFAVVTALVLGGWAACGAAGPTDLVSVSDREAMEAVGGQTPLCYQVQSTPVHCVMQGFAKNCTVEYCPTYIVVNLNFGVIDPNGASYASSPQYCTTCCGYLCGGSSNYTTGCSGP